jgi:hypothetical protein
MEGMVWGTYDFGQGQRDDSPVLVNLALAPSKAFRKLNLVLQKQGR